MLYEFEGKRPVISATCFIHPQASIIGNVEINNLCYIGAGAVIRGDYGKIVVGAGSAVEENVVIHSKPDTIAIIEYNVVIGHAAIVHGPCLIQRNTVVGMGAIVSDGCEIQSYSLLAAGSVLPPGHIVPSGKLAMGNPAKVTKDLDEKLLNYIDYASSIYQNLSQRSIVGLKPIES